MKDTIFYKADFLCTSMDYHPVYATAGEENLYETLRAKGYRPLIIHTLHYTYLDEAKKAVADIRERKEDFPEDAAHGLLVEIDKPHSEITNFLKGQQQHFDLLLGQGGLNKSNRFFIEQAPVDVRIDPQSQKRLMKRDFIHHFNMGLNHVLLKEAARRNIIIVVTLNTLLSTKQETVKGFGRLQQLFSLMRRYQVAGTITSCARHPCQIKSKQAYRHFLELYSLEPGKIAEMEPSLSDRVRENAFKRSSSYISEGIEVIE